MEPCRWQVQLGTVVRLTRSGNDFQCLSHVWSGAHCLRTLSSTRICSFFRARVFSLSLSFALTNMNVYQEGGNDTIENTQGQVNGQQGECLFGCSDVGECLFGCWDVDTKRMLFLFSHRWLCGTPGVFFARLYTGYTCTSDIWIHVTWMYS